MKYILLRLVPVGGLLPVASYNKNGLSRPSCNLRFGQFTPEWYLIAKIKDKSIVINAQLTAYQNQPPTICNIRMYEFDNAYVFKIIKEGVLGGAFNPNIKYKHKSDGLYVWARVGYSMITFSNISDIEPIEQEPDEDAIEVNGDIS